MNDKKWIPVYVLLFIPGCIFAISYYLYQKVREEYIG